MQLVRQAPYTIITVDARGWVTGHHDNVMLKDPTPYKPSEARFEASTQPRQNPLRLKAGWTLTKQSGDPPETVQVPWKYCKVANYAVVEMTQAEKDTRDAEIAAAKQAEENAETETTYESNVLIKAVLLCLKDSNPAMTLPTKAAIKAKYKQLKGW